MMPPAAMPSSAATPLRFHITIMIFSSGCHTYYFAHAADHFHAMMPPRYYYAAALFSAAAASFRDILSYLNFISSLPYSSSRHSRRLHFFFSSSFTPSRLHSLHLACSSRLLPISFRYADYTTTYFLMLMSMPFSARYAAPPQMLSRAPLATRLPRHVDMLLIVFERRRYYCCALSFDCYFDSTLYITPYADAVTLTLLLPI